jgi:predicted secreted protein
MQKIKLVCLLLTMMFVNVVYAASVPEYKKGQDDIIVTLQQPKFKITLSSNRTTGYRWYLEQSDNQEVLKLVKDIFNAPKGHMMGAPGAETWVFELNPDKYIPNQQIILHFSNLRPWDAKDVAETLDFKVTVK